VSKWKEDCCVFTFFFLTFCQRSTSLCLWTSRLRMDFSSHTIEEELTVITGPIPGAVEAMVALANATSNR